MPEVTMSLPQKLIKELGYWEQHDGFPVLDWQFEVANADTRLGYWEWVSNKIITEQEESDEKED